MVRLAIESNSSTDCKSPREIGVRKAINLVQPQL